MFDLNDLEKDKLQTLLNDEVLLAVLYKAFISATESQKPKVGVLDSNQLLGQKYRAYQISKEIINEAFDLLLAHKIEKPDKKLMNRAR